jgi:hypothetical protein
VEAAPVDCWREHQRLRIAFAKLPSQIAADRQMHRTTAVRAGRLDVDRQLLFSQLPFDEGRRYGVLGSSGEDVLTGAEPEAVRRGFRGNRESPCDASAPVAHQKEQVLFELIKDDTDIARVEPQRARDVCRLERSAAPDRLGHGKIPDAMMFRCHETQAFSHVPAGSMHFLTPGLGRNMLQPAASSKDHRLGHIPTISYITKPFK